MLGRSLNRMVLRPVALDHHTAATLAAPGSPCHLRQQLEGTLAAAEVRQEQPNISGDHAHQRHQRQVEPLGNHLGPNQHVCFLAGKALQDRLVRAFMHGRIGVPTQHTRMGRNLLHGFLDALGACAKELDALAFAHGAGNGTGCW